MAHTGQLPRVYTTTRLVHDRVSGCLYPAPYVHFHMRQVYRRQATMPGHIPKQPAPSLLVTPVHLGLGPPHQQYRSLYRQNPAPWQYMPQRAAWKGSAEAHHNKNLESQPLKEEKMKKKKKRRTSDSSLNIGEDLGWQIKFVSGGFANFDLGSDSPLQKEHTPEALTSEPHTPEPHTPDPHTPDPHTPDPHTSEPHTPEPHTPEPHTPEALNSEPHTPEPHTPEALNSEPHTPEPHTPEPHTPDPHTPDPHTPEPHTPDPHTSEPHTPEPHTPEALNSEPHTPEPHTPEALNSEPHTPEPHTPEPHTPEPHIPEPHTPEPHTPEPHTPEPHTPEPHAQEPQPPETQTSDTQTSETQTPETQTPETQTSSHDPGEDGKTSGLTFCLDLQENKRASLHVPIKNDNKGRQMMTRMGWKPGTGLGKNKSGILEPIKYQLRSRGRRAGLGSKSVDRYINPNLNSKISAVCL